ncbi:MAG: hypothetical protein FWG85_00920 [Bacteroidetes bacterium]|nr:hypothetical protein [Bacteroidota bacterium]
MNKHHFNKITTIILISFLNIISLRGQDVALNNWQIHTTMFNSLCAISDTENKIWIGTTGGIAIYENETDSLPILLNTGNKLLGRSVNTMINVGDYVIAGTADGVLEIINIWTLDCEHITSIKDHNLSNPAINDFYLFPDDNKLLIAGGFGLVDFDISRKIFMQTIFTIGDYTMNESINSIINVNDTLYISTPIGIAWIPIDAQINVPSNWTTKRYGSTLPYGQAKVVSYQGSIFAQLEKNIYILKDSFEIFANIQSPSSNYNFTDICIYDNKLLIVEDYQIRIVNSIGQPNNITTLYSNRDSKNNGIAVLNNNNLETKIIMLFDSLGAAFIKDDFSAEIKTPNTPYNNNFRGLALDKNGILYAVTDNSQKNQYENMFMSFDGNKWNNYQKQRSSTIRSYNSISISPDNKVYSGSWGYGLCVMKDTNDIIVYDQNNSALWGASSSGNGGFVVCGDICFDNKDNAWVTLMGATTSGPMVVMFDNTGKSYGFVSPFNGGLRLVFNMAIDNNNTKWIAGCIEQPGNAGLFCFNERNTIDDTTDDVWHSLTTSRYPNLLSNYFHSCKYDRFTNTIWLGTLNGISIINNPNAALTNSDFIIRSNKLLESQHINDIFIDPTGNKWIATKNGLWIINTFGDELLAHFTTNNSPLFTNDVQAITINTNNGLVYIGTANGLLIAQGNILMPNSIYEVKTYPQPYNIRRHNEVIIDGLTTESDLRIVTADGNLIKRIITSSKRAVWDGRDADGNLVPAGIYLVLTNSSVNKSGAAGKIVVVDY